MLLHSLSPKQKQAEATQTYFCSSTSAANTPDRLSWLRIAVLPFVPIVILAVCALDWLNPFKVCAVAGLSVNLSCAKEPAGTANIIEASVQITIFVFNILSTPWFDSPSKKY